MKVGIIGAGRIGKVHAKNISMFVPEMEIKTIADPFMNEQTEAFAKQCGIPNCTKDSKRHPQRPGNRSCTDLFLDRYALQVHHRSCARAGKHIFCEKPIDYDLSKVHAAINAAKEAGVKLQIGFCRRFDHNHRAVYDMVRDGKVGKVNIIKISSRDPESAPGVLCEGFRRYFLRHDDPRLRHGSLPGRQRSHRSPRDRLCAGRSRHRRGGRRRYRTWSLSNLKRCHRRD